MVKNLIKQLVQLFYAYMMLALRGLMKSMIHLAITLILKKVTLNTGKTLNGYYKETKQSKECRRRG